MKFQIERPLLSTSKECEPILRSLPHWFGIESAIVQYVKEIDNLPTFLARIHRSTQGFITIKRHNCYSAEIYVMGVMSQQHRKGIGRELVRMAEAYLRREGTEFLQAKTLSPSREDEGYANTRAFYSAMGFKPLEEFEQLWAPDNPCLLMVKYLPI
jgi:ribosomal protein S18 acetylase RimI-like enzyme